MSLTQRVNPSDTLAMGVSIHEEVAKALSKSRRVKSQLGAWLACNPKFEVLRMDAAIQGRTAELIVCDEAGYAVDAYPLRAKPVDYRLNYIRRGGRYITRTPLFRLTHKPSAESSLMSAVRQACAIAIGESDAQQ